jgi:hypothetical protein
VGAKSHKAQRVAVRLLVDQHQIGFNVTIPMILPIAGQGMVAVMRFQQRVGQQQEQDGVEIVVEGDSVPTFLLAQIVPFELGGITVR